MNELYVLVISTLLNIWQRRWSAACIAWIVCIGGWIFVAFEKDVYESNARIYVDTTSMLRPLLKNLAVESNVYHQLDIMRRTLLSDPNIEKVMRMTDLDLEINSPQEMADEIEDFRERVTVTASDENLFGIRYQAVEPEITKQVVQSILTIFVEGNLGQSRKDMDAARRFINEQLRSYESQLEAAEGRLAKFKQKNMAFLIRTANPVLRILLKAW